MKLRLDYLREDLIAAVIVFMVAIPLCLGIALASGAPLFSGIISGIVGGILTGILSPSHVSIAGPAAGMVAVVYAAINHIIDKKKIKLAGGVYNIYNGRVEFISE